MTCPNMLSAIVEALRSASATEEIIAAAVNAPTETQGAARASKDRAYRERKKARDETRDEIGRADCRAGRLGDETRDETPAIQVPRDETSQVPRDQIPYRRAIAAGHDVPQLPLAIVEALRGI